MHHVKSEFHNSSLLAFIFIIFNSQNIKSISLIHMRPDIAKSAVTVNIYEKVNILKLFHKARLAAFKTKSDISIQSIHTMMMLHLFRFTLKINL